MFQSASVRLLEDTSLSSLRRGLLGQFGQIICDGRHPCYPVLDFSTSTFLGRTQHTRGLLLVSIVCVVHGPGELDGPFTPHSVSLQRSLTGPRKSLTFVLMTGWKKPECTKMLLSKAGV